MARFKPLNSRRWGIYPRWWFTLWKHTKLFEWCTLLKRGDKDRETINSYWNKFQKKKRIIAWETLTMKLSDVQVLFIARWDKSMEMPGIDPGTSRMLSERSTIWATPPWRSVLDCFIHIKLKLSLVNAQNGTVKVSPRIINGFEAKIDNHPWLVSMWAPGVDSAPNHCGGAILHEEWILTGRAPNCYYILCD